MKTLFFVSAALLAACGGGKSDPDARPRIDARETPDAPPQPCTLDTLIAEPPVVDPDPNLSNTAAIKTQSADTPPVDIILWNWVVVGSGATEDLFQFTIPFPVVDLNTPLMLVQACTGDVEFCMVGLGDIVDDGAGGFDETQFFFPNTGELTITVAEDVGGDFTISMTDTRMDQYDNSTNPATQVDSDGDGTSDCNGTLQGFASTAIPVQAATVAPRTGMQFTGLVGKRVPRSSVFIPNRR